METGIVPIWLPREPTARNSLRVERSCTERRTALTPICSEPTAGRTDSCQLLVRADLDRGFAESMQRVRVMTLGTDFKRPRNPLSGKMLWQLHRGARGSRAAVLIVAEVVSPYRSVQKKSCRMATLGRHFWATSRKAKRLECDHVRRSGSSFDLSQGAKIRRPRAAILHGLLCSATEVRAGTRAAGDTILKFPVTDTSPRTTGNTALISRAVFVRTVSFALSRPRSCENCGKLLASHPGTLQ